MERGGSDDFVALGVTMIVVVVIVVMVDVPVLVVVVVDVVFAEEGGGEVARIWLVCMGAEL